MVEGLIERAARGLYASGCELASELLDGEDWPWEELPGTVKESYREIVRPTVALALQTAAEVGMKTVHESEYYWLGKDVEERILALAAETNKDD